MKRIMLGNTNIEVSEIGMGVLTIGKSQLNLQLDKGADLIKYALASGINFFDTAQYYETYEYMYEAFKDAKETPVICSKCLGWSYNEMEYAINEACSKLHRDYLDIFLMHEVRPNEARDGAWRALLDAKAAGKVKAIGISTHHIDIVNEYTKKEGLDVIFPLINFNGLGIRKGSQVGSAGEMAEAIETASNEGIAVFAMKVFGGGHLTCNYQEALDYVYNLSGVQSMMIGFGKPEEIDKAIAYVNGTLEGDYVPDTSQKKTYIEPGNCEGCGACIARCPNKALYFDENGLTRVDDSKCITCGYCAPICPVRAIILL